MSVFVLTINFSGIQPTICEILTENNCVSLIKFHLADYLGNKNLINKDAIFRFVSATEDINDLALLVQTFVNIQCPFSWTILEATLPSMVLPEDPSGNSVESLVESHVDEIVTENVVVDEVLE